MPDLHKEKIYVDDADIERSADYIWVVNWLEKWGEKIEIADYSTGGWEHIWDVSGPKEAIAEIPNHLRCASDWAEHA